MRYFVVSDDGNRFGPADIATLNAWIQEGRLLHGTLLEEEGSGARVAASAVSGLNFPTANPTSAGGGPNPGSIYSNPEAGKAPGTQNPYSAGYANSYAPPSDEGNTENLIAWILGGVGVLFGCCFGWVFAGVGAFLGYRAKEKGHRNGQPAMIFNIVVLVISLLFTILFSARVIQVMRDVQNNPGKFQRQSFTPPPGAPSNP